MLYALYGILVVVALIIFKKSGSFFKSLLLSAVGGASALLGVTAISFFLPLSIGFNFYTLAFSLVYSVPGVIFLLLSKALLF